MTDPIVKQRLYRAIKNAIRVIDKPKGSYHVTILNKGPFHIEAVRKKEIRKIRVVLDKITPSDIRAIKAVSLADICTKEIWCKKANRSDYHKTEV